MLFMGSGAVLYSGQFSEGGAGRGRGGTAAAEWPHVKSNRLLHQAGDSKIYGCLNVANQAGPPATDGYDKMWRSGAGGLVTSRTGCLMTSDTADSAARGCGLQPPPAHRGSAGRGGALHRDTIEMTGITNPLLCSDSPVPSAQGDDQEHGHPRTCGSGDDVTPRNVPQRPLHLNVCEERTGACDSHVSADETRVTKYGSVLLRGEDGAVNCSLHEHSYSECLNSDVTDKMCHNSLDNRTLWRNLFLVSGAFLLNFSAWVSLQSVTSTLHSEVGAIALSCYYGASVLSCLLAPVILKLLSTKWTMFVCMALHLPYLAAQFLPRPALLLPAALLLGAGTGALWTAQAVYVVALALQHARRRRMRNDHATQRFIAIFYCFYNAANVAGNLLSMTVLIDDDTPRHHDNDTAVPAPRHYQSVQVHVTGEHRPVWHTYVLTQMDVYNARHAAAERANLSAGRCSGGQPGPELLYYSEHSRLVLHLCQAGCACAALLLLALLDRVSLTVSVGGRDPAGSPRRLGAALLQLAGDARLLLLAPLVLFTGLQHGFLLADFTKSFVTCVVGARHIGVVLVCYGGVSAVSSFLADHVARHVTRYRVVNMGALLHTGALLTLMLWRPRPEDTVTLFTLAATLGLCHAIWDTQTNALFAAVFHSTPEAAFAVYRVLSCAGLAVAFGYSSFLPNTVKIVIMAVLLITGHLLYTILESKMSSKMHRRTS